MLKAAWNGIKKAAAVVTGFFVTASAALATEPADPVVAAFGDLGDKVAAYSLPLFAFAVIGVGIGIGLKYLKKARGAA